MRSFATSSIALVATAALTLAACGSDGDADGGGGGAGGDTGGLSGDDAALAAAIAADLVAEDEDGFSEAFDTDCMGVEVVKANERAEENAAERDRLHRVLDATTREKSEVDDALLSTRIRELRLEQKLLEEKLAELLAGGGS